MRRRTFVRVAVASGLGALVGCAEKSEEPTPTTPKPGTAKAADTTKAAAAGAVKDKPPYPVTTLCAKCGQVKGSAMCCCNKPDQERCAKCGLFKGSPGCCRISKPDVQKAACKMAGKPETVAEKAPYQVTTLCGKCGQVKGSDMCCCKKPDQERCAKCGLFKGSPGCCRMNRAEVQKAAMAMAAKV